MAKYKIKVKYAVWKQEEHEIDTEVLSKDFEDGPWSEEDQAQLEAYPYDYCSDETKTLDEEGHFVTGTLETTLEEITALDQIVEALDGQK